MSSFSRSFRQRSVRPGLESLQRRAARLAASSTRTQLSRDAAAPHLRGINWRAEARRNPRCTALRLSGLSLPALLDPTMACIAAIVTEPFKLSAAASPRDRFMIGAGLMAACATLTAAAVTHLGDGHRCMFQIIKKPEDLLCAAPAPLAVDLTMLRTVCVSGVLRWPAER